MAPPINYGDPISEIIIGSPVKPIRFVNTGANENILKMSGDLIGWSLINLSTSVGAKVDLLDGLDGNGNLIATITLSPNESIRDWFSVFGIRFTVGLFKLTVSGNIDGSVWVRL